MADIPLSSVSTDSVFSFFAVNNVGYAQEYPEFFAKVPDEVSCDIELLPFGDKVGDHFPNIFTVPLQSCPDQLSSGGAGEENV